MTRAIQFHDWTLKEKSACTFDMDGVRPALKDKEAVSVYAWMNTSLLSHEWLSNALFVT